MLSAELEQSIQRTLNKYGLNVSYKNAQYGGGNETTLSFRITVPKGVNEKADAQQATNDEISRQILGAEFSTGFVFSHGRNKYEVTGFSLNRPKFPVSAKRVKDGKSYKFHVEGVNLAYQLQGIKNKK